MKDIAIYGAGGFGREVACLINNLNGIKQEWNFIGFFDDAKPLGTFNEYGYVLGGMNELNQYDKELHLVIAVGAPYVIKNIVERIANSYIVFPNLIAPDVRVVDPESFFIGRGNIITWGCLVSCNVRIGDFNVLNGFITLGHDVEIGTYNAIMPGVRISGNVLLRSENFLGVGSVILQNIIIGNKTVIGANSTVIRNTKDNFTYVGNPAKIIKY